MQQLRLYSVKEVLLDVVSCAHRRDDDRTLRIFDVLKAVAEAAIERGERPVIGPAWRREIQPSPSSP
jgi:hypothetical protein